MTTKNIIKKAQYLYEGMDWQKRKEGQDNETTIAVIVDREGKRYQELLDLTFKVSEKASLSMDAVYSFTLEALKHIADSTATSMDDLEYPELEADVYTSDLTEWLNERNEHVYYLTEALRDFDCKDGFEALTYAQLKAKEEVFSIVLEHLQSGN